MSIVRIFKDGKLIRSATALAVDIDYEKSEMTAMIFSEQPKKTLWKFGSVKMAEIGFHMVYEVSDIEEVFE